LGSLANEALVKGSMLKLEARMHAGIRQRLSKDNIATKAFQCRNVLCRVTGIQVIVGSKQLDFQQTGFPQRLRGFLTERCFALFCGCFDGFMLPAACRALDRTGTCFLTGNFVCAPSGTMKRIAKARSFLSMLE
jgi:hypothetical protein